MSNFKRLKQRRLTKSVDGSSIRRRRSVTNSTGSEDAGCHADSEGVLKKYKRASLPSLFMCTQDGGALADCRALWRAAATAPGKWRHHAFLHSTVRIGWLPDTGLKRLWSIGWLPDTESEGLSGDYPIQSRMIYNAPYLTITQLITTKPVKSTGWSPDRVCLLKQVPYRTLSEYHPDANQKAGTSIGWSPDRAITRRSLFDVTMFD